MTPITDRKKLFDESAFVEFENDLTELINSGEYLDVICRSALTALEHLFDLAENDLDVQQTLNDSLRSSDDKEVRNQKIKRKLAEFCELIPDRRKRLTNFVYSRESDNRNSLKEYLKNQLESIGERNEKRIDKEIKVFEDFDRIELEKGCAVPKYFSGLVSSDINVSLLPELDKRTAEGLDHLYDEAIMKVTDFVSEKQEKNDRVALNISTELAEFDPEDMSGKAEIEKYGKQLDQAIAKMQTAEEASRSCLEELKDFNYKIKEVDEEKKSARKDRDREIRQLGAMPDVEIVEVIRERPVSRRGLFRILDLFSTKMVPYYDKQEDYTKQNKWKAEREAIEERLSDKLRRHESKIEKLEEQRRKKEIQYMQEEKNRTRLSSEIEYIDEAKRNAEKIYEENVRNNKREYCETQKKRIKEEIRKALLDRENENCMLYKLQEHIDKVSDDNLPAIIDKVTEYFDSSVARKKEMLNNLINKNDEELKAQYELSGIEASKLRKIRKNCRKVVDGS